MRRSEIINQIIAKFGYTSYLEIGVNLPHENFDLIAARDKDGVDPAGRCNHQMTSDQFFASNKKKYGVVFIDGLHLEKQVLKDIRNSLECLEEGGTIVCHDCNPIRAEHQSEQDSRRGTEIVTWNGTTWKAIADLRMHDEELEIFTVDADEGCSVIRRGGQKLFPAFPRRELTYEFLEFHRAKLLNLVSVAQFTEWLGSKT